MNFLDRLDTTLRVVGGARLEGSVEIQGAKNAALPIMAAALLARGKVTLHRVPRITDVSVMWSLLEALGARLSLQDRNTITIDAANVSKALQLEPKDTAAQGMRQALQARGQSLP